MTDLSFSAPAAAPRMPALSAQMLRDAPAFTRLGVLIALSAIPVLAAMVLDTRDFQDTGVWTKPFKFQSALAVYLLTLAAYARWLPAGLAARRWFRAYAAVICAAIVAELVWIIGAAANGSASHFNDSTPALAILYGIMGLAAVILTTGSLTFGIAIARNPATGLPPALRAGLSLGLILTFLLTIIVAGYMSSTTGHLVGTPVSGRMVPLMGWSREVGDLRVAHFFATHALHIIPLGAWLAAIALPPRPATLTAILIAAAYCALVAFTFQQALTGQPFLS